jgi:hypothetical protein
MSSLGLIGLLLSDWVFVVGFRIIEFGDCGDDGDILRAVVGGREIGQLGVDSCGWRILGLVCDGWEWYSI